MKNISREDLNIIYQENDLALGDADGKVYLVKGERSYFLSNYPLEPILYVKASDGTMITIHQAFTVDSLCHAALTNGSITLISGDDYDLPGICKLILKAIDLPMESVDSSYVEGCCFMDYMKEHGAVSPETAMDLSAAGMKNTNVMNPFIHSKNVSCTSSGLFYLLDPKEKGNAQKDPESCFRVISNQARFGCGYRTIDGRKQFYAWHGYANRNDDFITYAEIGEGEYEQINREYPHEISANRDTAELFRNKYVDGHRVLAEGWNVSLPLIFPGRSD